MTFNSIKQDFSSSIAVFLVALPLCLGIALACGAPLSSGIIAGIAGGIVTGLISKSHISVSGPAAGLATVILSSINQLGSFEIFISAVLFAGVFQILIGIFKGGFIANYIPSNIIKGLLAAIGIILILKQLPHAMGLSFETFSEFSYNQTDGKNTFTEIFDVIKYFSPGAIVISIFSFLILIFWEKPFIGYFKFIPGALAVVLFGILMNIIYMKFIPELSLQIQHVVKIPKPNSLTSIISFPSFSSIANHDFWIIVITLTIVASLESLINLEAVENIDPHKRQASPNNELIAQGVGNIFSGFFGGLPITSVIVRSSVNVNSGAKTKLSAILHGVWLLAGIFFLSAFINLIPLASLAVILIFTGYKLAKISIFKEIYKKGLNQFIPFIFTVLAIVFTDLLLGIIIGSAVSMFYLLKSNFKNPFLLEKETLYIGETLRMELPNQVSFLNKATIKDTLWHVPTGSNVVIDATYCDFIDNDVLETIEDFKNTVSVENNIKLNLIGFKNQYQLEDRIQFVNVLDKETQQKLAPEEIINILKKGNDRFVNGSISEKYLKHQVNATSFGQNPFAIILSCIDSRTTAEHIFDLGLGDIFSVRIAGNIINKDILGSMEFGVHLIGVKLVVVLGHTSCGAIRGACDNAKLGNLTELLDKIKPAIDIEKTVNENRNGSNNEFVNKVAVNNVYLTIDRVRNESELISQYEKEGKIKIIGGLYDIETGKVDFFE
ncbi:MAG: bifunctional SulP family inorganic anion transporter/carbonic anhydrase [Bacteroidia bacterium]|nr:bifunctional SulP family inorganic anion transporter/carbonic anhydrase [Bacteroidia bacterium]